MYRCTRREKGLESYVDESCRRRFGAVVYFHFTGQRSASISPGQRIGRRLYSKHVEFERCLAYRQRDDEAWAKAWPFVHSAQMLDQSNNCSAALAQYNKALPIYPEAVVAILGARVDQSRLGLKSASMRSWQSCVKYRAYGGRLFLSWRRPSARKGY